jgi:predicted Fe-S protein YdhL (DUF1289 family)
MLYKIRMKTDEISKSKQKNQRSDITHTTLQHACELDDQNFCERIKGTKDNNKEWKAYEKEVIEILKEIPDVEENEQDEENLRNQTTSSGGTSGSTELFLTDREITLEEIFETA